MQDSLIIGVDFSEDDDGVVIVGRRKADGSISIINVLLNDDAKELYDLLTKVRCNHDSP